MIFVGDDWSEDHHDINLMGDDGAVAATRRLGEGLDGVRALHELLADYAHDPAEVVIGIETDRGLWVNALVAAGSKVYAVNPKAVSRYRDRHRPGGGKSDPGDAKVLADLVRTDRHNHRLVAGDSAEVEAVKVLARAHQSLVWARTRHLNQLRSRLREYYPAALEAFKGELGSGDAVAVLGLAPTPGQGAGLSLNRLRSALKRGGRQRNIDARAREVRAALRSGQPGPGALSQAFGAATTTDIALVAELNRQISDLETQLAADFRQHPDAVIYLSMPGLGDVLGARVLGESGDDPERYATAKSRKNYAGTTPLTIASGRKRAVTARYVRNRRLYDAIDAWAFCSLQNSPGARAYYDHRRAMGDLHHQALRAVGNRFVGILHGCARTRTLYDEHTAWGHRQENTQEIPQAA